MPQTMAAAERQTIVARTQSPLVRLMNDPKPTEADQAH
jgi:hypothetical protein